MRRCERGLTDPRWGRAGCDMTVLVKHDPTRLLGEHVNALGKVALGKTFLEIPTALLLTCRGSMFDKDRNKRASE